jgi:hypothetical protein
MGLFATDILVLAAITQLVRAEEHERISYADIAQKLALELDRLTIVKSIARLESNNHLRRVGGLTRKGYKYELSTTVSLAISVHK